jgi:dihydrofolate reductase
LSVRLALIAAVARNNVIGASGKLPWHLPSDLAFFKRVTMGKPIIMGRKTFEAIGRPLPGRVNIVVTARKRYDVNGIQIGRSFEEAVELARKAAIAAHVDEIFVIGGGEIYRQAIGAADRLYITHVDAVPEGDTLFPSIDPAIWTGWPASGVTPGEKDTHSFEVRVYERR